MIHAVEQILSRQPFRRSTSEAVADPAPILQTFNRYGREKGSAEHGLRHKVLLDRKLGVVSKRRSPLGRADECRDHYGTHYRFLGDFIVRKSERAAIL